MGRSMTDIYTRQQTMNLEIPDNVTVAGVGGVGTWVAIYSAMSGVPNLFLFDPDLLEESNLNRLPFCAGGLNRPKVEVVADFIKAIRPEATIAPIQEKLSGLLLDIQLQLSSYIVDCTDSPKSQIEMYNSCQKSGRGYIRAGYDGTHITVTSTVSGWIRKDVEEEHYQINPSWVVPSSIVAAMAVAKLVKYPTQEVSLDISEIGIPALRRTRTRTDRCWNPEPEPRATGRRQRRR